MKSIEIESHGHLPESEETNEGQRAYDGGTCCDLHPKHEVDVVSVKVDHSGPIELMTDVLDRLGDARVSGQAMS